MSMKDSGVGPNAMPAGADRRGIDAASSCALNRANLPSPQPSPDGRGSPLRLVQASPLPWGEGQGEGLNTRSKAHPANGQLPC